jgi:3-dehydrosphinganine reductase
LDASIDEIKQQISKESQRFGCFSADVTDMNAVREAVKRAENECGPIAVLVNSAGVSNPGYVENLSISGMEEEIRVNYLGTVYMIKHVLNGMIQRRKGWILNVSSLAGLKGIFGYTGYCGSKFAVIGFSEALRSEVRPYNVKVSVLCPPDVDTPMLRKENRVKPLETLRISELGKVMEADEAARAAMRGLDKAQFIIIPDLSSKAFRLMNAVMPSLIDKFLDKKIDKVRSERGLD